MKETQEKQNKESVLDILRIKNIRAKITSYRGNPQVAISELEQITESLRSLGERKQYALALLDRREFQLTTFDIVGALRSTEEAKSILGDLGDLSEMMDSQCLATIFAFIGDVQMLMQTTRKLRRWEASAVRMVSSLGHIYTGVCSMKLAGQTKELLP